MWDISPAFRAAIQAPVHTITVKAQVLDTAFNVVAGGEFYDTGSERYIQNYIVDGSVDADSARNTRRTMTMSLLNPEAEFTPDSEWGGLFYVDRLIRIWRGVVVGEYEEFVPVGTFMIDTADVVAERNMSIVALTGSDLWKKIAKAKFGHAVTYSAGTPVQDVIKSMAQDAGVTLMQIDDLSHRNANQRNLGGDLSCERDEFIGDKIATLATDWGLDIYFDAMGRFVSEENRLDRPTVWSFRAGEDNSLLTVRASYKDELFYNHVMVAGTGDENNVVHAEASDTDPSSPTNITRLGRRTFMYESKFIYTVEQAQDTANKLLAQHLKVVEDIELQSICIPAFEANDVISVREDEFTMLDRTLRIRSFNVPLSSSRQTIRLQRMVTV